MNLSSNDIQLLSYLKDFLNNGYDIEQALNICNEVVNDKRVDEILKLLDNGLSIDEAIRNCGFQKMWVSSFNFFYQTNSIASAIDKSLKQMILIEDSKKKIKEKLWYPLLLITLVLLFSIYIRSYLLPIINNMIIDFDIDNSLLIKLLLSFIKLIPIIIYTSTIILFIIIYIAYLIIMKKNYKLAVKLTTFEWFSSILKDFYSYKFCLFFNEFINLKYDINSILEYFISQNFDYDIKNIATEYVLYLKKGEDFNTVTNRMHYFSDYFKNILILSFNNNFKNNWLEMYLDQTMQLINKKIVKSSQYFIVGSYMITGLFIVIVYILLLLPLTQSIQTI